MKVFRIGNGEVSILNEALDALEEANEVLLKDELEPMEEADVEYTLAHIRTTKALLKDLRLQELCERCLSYFWDMYTEVGCLSDELEELCEDMGISEEEFIELFKEAGYGDN